MANSAALQLKPWSVYIDPATALVDPRLKALLAYWEERKLDGHLPSRKDVSPQDLVPHLPNMLLLNVVENGTDPMHFSVRLSGTAIDHLVGHDYREAVLGDLVSPATGRLMAASFSALVRHRRPLRFYGRLALPGDGDAWLEMLALPLAEPGGPVNMILGELVPIRRSDQAVYTELTNRVPEAAV